jgi:hypothetical protein
VETVRLNGVCTMDLIKSLVDTVSKLCGEVDHLKNNNACLKNQLKDLQDAVQADNVGYQLQSSQVFTYSEIVERPMPSETLYRDSLEKSKYTVGMHYQQCQECTCMQLHCAGCCRQQQWYRE